MSDVTIDATVDFFQRLRRDGVSWRALQDEIAITAHLADSERAFLRTAYQDLDRLLGNALFLPGHPIEQWIWDASAISRRRFLHLHSMLNSTRASGNVAAMLLKLTQQMEAKKTLDVLEWWSGLLAQGCTADFEPALPHKHGQADLHITDPQECYIELTELESSQTRASLRATLHLLQHLVHVPGLCFAGRLSQGISAREWSSLVNDVLALRSNAEHGNLAIMERSGAMVLGLAPIPQQESLVAWAAQEHVQLGQFLSPPSYSNSQSHTDWWVSYPTIGQNHGRCCSMKHFIGCGAHKKYSVFVAVDDVGGVKPAVRVNNDRERYRTFLRGSHRAVRSQWKRSETGTCAEGEIDDGRTG